MKQTATKQTGIYRLLSALAGWLDEGGKLPSGSALMPDSETETFAQAIKAELKRCEGHIVRRRRGDECLARRSESIHEQITEAHNAAAGSPRPPDDPESPDDEDMNGNRSNWAEAAVVAFGEATGSDLEDAIADLIGDLGHFCDRHGMNLHTQISRGQEFYSFETQEEGKQFKPEEEL